jgi:SAM-dependent methyltransferase
MPCRRHRGGPATVTGSWAACDTCGRTTLQRRRSGPPRCGSCESFLAMLADAERRHGPMRLDDLATIHRDAYDDHAAGYTARWADPATAPGGLLERFAAAVPAGGLVVDVGCGPGRDLRLLHGRGFRTVGMDLSARMLTRARRQGATGPLVQADMTRLPLRPGSADGLWLCASLLHVPKRAAPAVLALLARTLRGGGPLALIVRQGDGERWTRTGGWRLFTYWQPDELDQTLGTAGLRVRWRETSPDQLGRDQAWLWRIVTRKDGSQTGSLDAQGRQVKPYRALGDQAHRAFEHAQPGDAEEQR